MAIVETRAAASSTTPTTGPGRPLATSATAAASAAAATAATAGDQPPAACVQTAEPVIAILTGEARISQSPTWACATWAPVSRIRNSKTSITGGAPAATRCLGNTTFASGAALAISANGSATFRAVHAISAGGAAAAITSGTKNTALAIKATVATRLTITARGE